MARALKVFSYSDGFHSWTVAATSRARALEAWGVKRDLFKDGSAVEAVEGPDREAALQAPGELIERGLSVDIGKVEKTRAPKAVKTRGPSVKDVARVELLEEELAELEAGQVREAEALEERRAALEREAAALADSQLKARDALKAKLKAARVKLN
ncbi:hypothetical protein [Brevundimonas sp. Root1423]|uniref:hypothetical protein n=1 Tax=Brevundimonas sp. Root1423 TaxID=1736462 RepID=UPI0006FB6669|nr:hypothetical protein [Brevundimonas sp. Root1423]KQY75207.1 hypothetical protein ASD25_11595 [Brevundimonas sp. Root1423]